MTPPPTTPKPRSDHTAAVVSHLERTKLETSARLAKERGRGTTASQLVIEDLVARISALDFAMKSVVALAAQTK